MKKIFLKTLIFSVLIFTCSLSQVMAQDNQLSLKDAVETGVVNSTDIQSAWNTLQKSVNNSKVSSLMPSLSLKASASESVNLLNISSIAAPTLNFSTGFTWSFGSSNLIGMDVDDLTLENAELTYISKVLSQRASITTSYWNIVNLSNKVRIAQNSFDTAKANLERTTELYNASKATSSALVQSRLSLTDAQFSLQNAKDSLSNALDSFADLTGIQDAASLQFEQMPDVDLIDSSKLEALVNERLEGTVKWKSADVARALSIATAKKTTVNAKAPSLTATVTGSYAFNSATKNSKNSLSTTGTVLLNIPVDSYIPGTQSNANVKNAELDVQNAEITWKKTTDSLSDSAATSIRTIAQLVNSRSTLLQYAEAANENYQQVSKSYQEGYASAYELTNALSSYTNAMNSVETNSMSLVTNLCTIASLVDMDFGQLMEALR